MIIASWFQYARSFFFKKMEIRKDKKLREKILVYFSSGIVHFLLNQKSSLKWIETLSVENFETSYTSSHLVVISAGSEQLFVGRPLESTYFLFVSVEVPLGDDLGASGVPLQDTSVS